MYLFFDTETTGFPPGAPYVHLVQLAWLLCDDKGEECAHANLIVKPEGWQIPDESAAVHGISHNYAVARGVRVGFALALFMAGCDLANNLVGHNLAFDKKIMIAEFERVGWDDPMTNRLAEFCTMKTPSVVDYCGCLNKLGRLKRPKLMELHKKLFDCEFESAHDALADIRATAKCFWELRKLGKI